MQGVFPPSRKMLDGRERPEGGRPGLVEGLVDHDLVREMMEENARDHQHQRAWKSLKNLLEERGGFGNNERGTKMLTIYHGKS